MDGDLFSTLLVEDNRDDYEAIIRSFGKNEFASHIKWCRSGQDALNYLNKEGEYKAMPGVRKPDLILLDLNMPGIDGRKFLEIIKKDEELKKLPVVVLTTSADIKDVEQCYKLGASTYIQKPVSMEGLNTVIKTIKDYWFTVAILPGRG